MKTQSLIALGFAATLFAVGSIMSQPEASEPAFTGDRLTILYVRDVLRSVSFYQDLGFQLDHFYDYGAETYTRSWSSAEPPHWAEVHLGKNVRIGLTSPEEEKQVYGGGARHYFLITNVEEHFASVRAGGIIPEPNEIEERPWMDFFTVSDPDGHQIVFGRKNQDYYDAVRKKIDSLPR